MCSQSVSGSSLLSGYNEDDARETSGRSRREFEEIDAVLYNEEKAKRSSIKKICEEWSSKPHFRVRGRLHHIQRQPTINLLHSFKQNAITNFETTSILDLLATNTKLDSLHTSELNVLLDDAASGRSSIDSIEGSELTNNSDIDDDANSTIQDDRFSGAAADSFDTDEDDDENNDRFSDMSTHDHLKHRYHHHHHHHSHSKHPHLLIKCMKDSIINSLAAEIIQRFLSNQQPVLQRYAKLLCARNSIKLRPKLRPYSLPPRSLSQNRYSLPTASSITATSALLQITALPLRSTPEPGMKLTDLLRVTPLRLTNLASNTNPTISPRKSLIPPSLPPPPPPTERTPTSLIIDKRNQQQISLVGTAVVNPPSSQLTVTTALQTSQNPIRQTPSAHRYRSATTVNTNVQTIEPNTRLPPINIERLTSNDQLTISRSNTTTTIMGESIPRAVSGTSIGSNISSAVKLRTLSNAGKLQRISRPVTTSSINHNTKDLNNSSSTSPARSITATTAPSSSLRTTAATRTQQQQQQQQQQQHQKRPLVTTKAPPPPSSGVIKVPAPHIW